VPEKYYFDFRFKNSFRNLSSCLKFSREEQEDLSHWLTPLQDFQVRFLILALLEGEGDEFPEAAFYMMGTMEEAFEEGRRLASMG